MKPDIWMPMYWADFLADTLHLNRAEIGSYVLMIGAYWRRGGPLPDDNEQLRQICRCDSQEWARCKGTMASFFSVAGGVWTHKRIDSEIAEAVRNKELQHARTKAATEARRNVTTNVTSNVTTDVTFTPSPSPSPSTDIHSGFKKPAIEAIKLEAAKIGLSEVEADHFFDHYESNGWKVGRTTMKSWPAALRNWKRNYDKRTYQSHQPNSRPSGPDRNAGTYNAGRNIEGLKAKVRGVVGV